MILEAEFRCILQTCPSNENCAYVFAPLQLQPHMNTYYSAPNDRVVEMTPHPTETNCSWNSLSHVHTRTGMVRLQAPANTPKHPCPHQVCTGHSNLRTNYLGRPAPLAFGIATSLSVMAQAILGWCTDHTCVQMCSSASPSFPTSEYRLFYGDKQGYWMGVYSLVVLDQLLLLVLTLYSSPLSAVEYDGTHIAIRELDD
jgi:hypothetical protein